jgi:hypothetical protein
MTRTRLPNRRPHETIGFEFRRLAYTVGVGCFAEGSLAELFIDCSKGSSPLAADAREAVVASQFWRVAESAQSVAIRLADGRAHRLGCAPRLTRRTAAKPNSHSRLSPITSWRFASHEADGEGRPAQRQASTQAQRSPIFDDVIPF